MAGYHDHDYDHKLTSACKTSDVHIREIECAEMNVGARSQGRSKWLGSARAFISSNKYRVNWLFRFLTWCDNTRYKLTAVYLCWTHLCFHITAKIVAEVRCWIRHWRMLVLPRWTGKSTVSCLWHAIHPTIQEFSSSNHRRKVWRSTVFGCRSSSKLSAVRTSV